jgi:rhodanese-related sulfurtransferase
MSSYSFNSPPIPQISIEDFSRLLAEPDDRPELQLVDVREPEELAIAQLEGFTHLPLSQFAEWSIQIQERLDPHAPTIVMCHHGMRSAQMCQWLMNQGFTDVKNLVGGIDAYSTAIDASIPRY